jgi:hypothetical protein
LSTRARAENVGPGLALVSADADANNGGVFAAHFGGLMKDLCGGFYAEVTDSVEDPVGGDAEVGFGLFAGPLQALEERLKLDSAPVVDDPYGDVDLGMNDSLRGQALEHAVSDELVVFRRSQPFRHGLEGHEESGEVFVFVDGAGLFEGERLAVVAAA